MRTSARWLGLTLGLSAFAGLAASTRADSRVASDDLLDRLGASHAVGFVENLGQWATPAEFVARVGGEFVRIEGNALLLQAPDASGRSGVVFELVFENASANCQLHGIEPRPGRHHFFLGSDPTQWVSDAQGWGGVRWSNVQPGIDFVLREIDGKLKYDVELDSGADLSRFVVRVKGADSLDLDACGDLVARNGDVVLTQPLSACWQVGAEGTRISRTLRFLVLDGGRFAFDVPDRVVGLPLVIDPGLVFSTHLGSSTTLSVGDYATKVALDSGGNVIVTGWAGYPQFPVTPGAYVNQHMFSDDMFVTKFSADGTQLLWSTRIGGQSSIDRGRALVVADDGTVTVGGETHSPDFPTTPGALDAFNLGADGFVLRLSALGNQLIYSTLLGDSAATVYALALCSTGSVIAGGLTAGLPTSTAAFEPTYQGNWDGFLCRLSPTGSSLEWSTYLGASHFDLISAITMDSDESITFVGAGASPGLPTTPGVFQPTYPGGPFAPETNGFVGKMAADGASLIWLSYFGGSLGRDDPTSVAMTPEGDVLIVGITTSSDFLLTPGVYQAGPYLPDSNGFDSFVMRVKGDGTAIQYSTIIANGPGEDYAQAVVCDSSGTITVTGSGGGNYPTTPGAYDRNPVTGTSNLDATVFRLNPRGTRLLYSTFVGEAGLDYALGLALQPDGRVVICGSTDAPFPVTPGVIGPNYIGGQSDGFVLKFDLQPTGCEVVGRSTPGCRGPITMGGVGVPMAPSSVFGVYASGAPLQAPGWLIVGFPPSQPLLLHGVQVWFDPSQRFVRIPVQTDVDGYVETNLPLPASLQSGTTVIAQYVFPPVATCPQTMTWSASHALRITLQ